MAKPKGTRQLKGARRFVDIPEAAFDLIYELVKDGATLTAAASAAGIPKRSHHYYLKQGRAGVEPYTKYTDMLERAENALESLLLQRIQEAGTNALIEKEKVVTSPDGGVTRTVEISEKRGSWAASAWLLMKRYPEKYGKDIDAGTEALEPDDYPSPVLDPMQPKKK